MSKVKFQNYSGIKNEQHTPRAIAGVDLKNGYAVVIKHVDGKETATLPAAAEAKGKDLYFVWNVITTPELLSDNDFVVKAGQPVRAFSFEQSTREILEISGDLVAKGTKVGDKLVVGTDGKYAKATDVTGYAVYLEVVGTNTIGGSGFDVVVRA